MAAAKAEMQLLPSLQMADPFSSFPHSPPTMDAHYPKLEEIMLLASGAPQFLSSAGGPESGGGNGGGFNPAGEGGEQSYEHLAGGAAVAASPLAAYSASQPPYPSPPPASYSPPVTTYSPPVTSYSSPVTSPFPSFPSSSSVATSYASIAASTFQSQAAATPFPSPGGLASPFSSQVTSALSDLASTFSPRTIEIC
ncbi:PREDICTED: early growth response protein 1-like [Gekko japonicus]|uniref:Early growth response protein 1-like n=1 Tax=Gekko japonicus TaxID=146911 RepID=A0ABM1JN22_GEKJA|nr:PREDICTED: early growth response protein 1-like [Gekko japonicus]